MTNAVQCAPPSVAGEQDGYEADLNQLLAEADRLNELMQGDRAEIERLKEETRILKAGTRALLASMVAHL